MAQVTAPAIFIDDHHIITIAAMDFSLTPPEQLAQPADHAPAFRTMVIP
jgi:hypothetical protein